MSRGKNFNLYLMDGEVTGKIKCTLSNWTGVAYKIPRACLNDCKERKHLKQSGVYFLFSKNEDNQEEVYIGQAGTRKNGEGILLRILEHLKDENYFTDVIVLTTQNNSFGPTEISYLENRFTNLAKENDRYIIRNGNEPNPGNVTEEKESELEDFVEYSKIVLGVLGYKVFVPIIKHETPENKHENRCKNKNETNIEAETKDEDKTENNENNNEIYLHLERYLKEANKTIKAICKRTAEGFVVLPGSMVALTDTPKYYPKNLTDIRDKCISNGVIKNGVLQKSQLFASPSSAAMFVLGVSSNGRTEWTLANGETLKSYEERIQKEQNDITP